MAAPPPLFDPHLARLRLDRARQGSLAMFLHQETADLIKERLEEVNRPFPDRRIVTPHAAPWRDSGITDQVVAANDILDLPQAGLDLIVHGLCLHNANDPVGQLVQCRRALRDDGLCLAVLFGGQTLHELRSSMAQAETELRGGISPRVHPMGEIRDLGALLQRAGFALPVADSLTLTASYQSLLHLMRDLRAMAETNILSQQDRRFLRRDVLARASEIYARVYGMDDGRIPATFELVFLTGWAPAANQQKPLRPGSAATRLADALDTTEHSAGEIAAIDPSSDSE